MPSTDVRVNRRKFIGLVEQARSGDAWARGNAYPRGLYEAIMERTATDAEFTFAGSMSGDESWMLAIWSFPLVASPPKDGRVAFLVKRTQMDALLREKPKPAKPTKPTQESLF